jgi:diguanylate cyclase (GGDEF)-like protein
MTESRAFTLCAVLAIAAVAAGIGALLADRSGLGLVAGVAGLSAALVGVALDVRVRRAERAMWEWRSGARQARRELEQLRAAAAEEASVDVAHAADVAVDAADVVESWETDPVSGMLVEPHLTVVLAHAVANARRKVVPLAVVVFVLDGLDAAPAAPREQAMAALGEVARRTLRESDAIFRAGPCDAVAVLGDTAEPGAVKVADRVREALRDSPIGGALTVSAGIACYPSHTLDGGDLVRRARYALRAAREHGHERDHVAVASDE